MRKVRMVCFATIVVSQNVVIAQTPTDLSWERQTGGFARVSVFVSAETPAERIEDFDGIVMPAMGVTLAEDTAIAMTQNGAQRAEALSMGEAVQIIAPSQETFVPTSNAVMSAEFLAATDGATTRAGVDTDIIPNQAITRGTYASTATESQMAWLHGALYLTAIQGTAGNVSIVNGFVFASAGQWSAQAQWLGAQGWRVTATLPGGVQVDKIVQGVNEYFDFVVPVDLSGLSYEFVSDVRHRSTVTADGQNSLSSINGGYSAGAWGVLTPVGLSPLDGDFDGNGMVDGNDLGALSSGAGTTLGATLSGGEGNHDGVVDGMDFLLWQRNLGRTYSSPPARSATVIIPEPVTLVSSSTTVIVFCWMQRANRRRKLLAE